MPKPAFAEIGCKHGNDLGCRLLAFVPDSRSIVGFLTEMGQHEGIARWDAGTGKLQETLKQPKKSHAEALGCSDDGQRLAVRFGDSVAILDAGSLKETAKLKVPARTLGWSPDGRLVATVFSQDVKCWDAGRGRPVASLTLTQTKECDDIGFVGFAKNAAGSPTTSRITPK